MTTLRERMQLVQCTEPQTVRCSLCTVSWQRPAGMTEARCPKCVGRRGVYDRSPGEQLALDVTRYRLAIEEATAHLQSGRSNAALTVLLSVEARGRGVTTGRIIGPSLDRQGLPDTPAPAQSPASADVEDDPIALVRSLALGVYRLPAKGGAHGRRRRP